MVGSVIIGCGLPELGRPGLDNSGLPGLRGRGLSGWCSRWLVSSDVTQCLVRMRQPRKICPGKD